MSLCSGLLQSIQNTCIDPKLRIRSKSSLARNLIGNLKANSLNIFRQPIAFQDLIHFIPIIFIYLNSHFHANTVILQKKHCLAHLPLIVNLFCYAYRHFLTDAFDLCQSFRLTFNNCKCVLSKPLHNTCRQCRSNTFYRT